jgi:hypothetical protein
LAIQEPIQAIKSSFVVLLHLYNQNVKKDTLLLISQVVKDRINKLWYQVTFSHRQGLLDQSTEKRLCLYCKLLARSSISLGVCNHKGQLKPLLDIGLISEKLRL